MLRIRECINSDFDQIYLLLGQLWPGRKLNKPEYERYFRAGLRSNKQIYICATQENKIVGFCSMTIRDHRWETKVIGFIHELIIDEQCRDGKAGVKLINKMISIARAKNCKKIELDSALCRKRAHKFYLKNEFEKNAYLFSKKI